MTARLKTMRSLQRAARRAKRQRRQIRAHRRMWGATSWCERRQDHQLHPLDRTPPVVRLPRSWLDEIFGVTTKDGAS